MGKKKRSKRGNSHPRNLASASPPLPPKLFYLCSLIAKTPSNTLEPTLNALNIFVTKTDILRILANSYAHPANAITFFRWSASHFTHTATAWNLLVDILGRNRMFDAMWDTLKSMDTKGLVNLDTFSSVFASYVSDGKEKDAIRAFDLMGNYHVARDVRALNSLLCALCREGKIGVAVEFMRVAKERVRLNQDTFAVLLEGCEMARDVDLAKRVFEEMVEEIGWDKGNVYAYDSFLVTLVKGEKGLNEALLFFDVLKQRGCFPGVRFLKVVMEECVKCSDVKDGLLLWETLVGEVGLRADTELYNSLMGLYCFGDAGSVRLLVDEMVSNGVFPDSGTYNILLKFFIKSRELKEVLVVFNEMRKNEIVPDLENCSSVLRLFLDAGDTYMGIKIWKCMLENYESDLEESGDYLLVIRLHDLDRLQEAAKFAEIMMDRGIKLNASTVSKLQESLCNLGKESICLRLLRKRETRDV